MNADGSAFFSRRISRHPAGFTAVVILLFAVSFSKLQAEETQAADKPDSRYFQQVGRDLKAVTQSPLKWKGKDLLIFGAVAGTGVILASADEDIRKAFQNSRTPGTDDAARIVDHFGDGAVLTALMAGVYGAGLIADKPGLRRTALLGFESYVISGLFVAGIKTIVGRSRPRAEEGSLRFRPFSTASRRTSFPSGHSSAVWAVAVSVADGSDSPVVDALSYSLAVLASLARIHEDKHWASDVFFGAAIGYASAKMICRMNRGEKTPEVRAGVAFISGCPALSLSVVF